MKRKPLREQLAESQALRQVAESALSASRDRVTKLEQLILAYKRFSLKVCMQRDIKHDAPPHSHALAMKEALEAGTEVERLSRELWPEEYARLDEKMTEITKEEDPKWN
jgi:hypothetical protein